MAVTKGKVAMAALGLAAACGLGASAYLYSVTGSYGFWVLWKRGGSVWTASAPDDPRLSPAMRLALAPNPPVPTAGEPAWAEAMPGFDTGEMAVLADGKEVDRVLLARFDPKRFEFETLNDVSGSRGPAEWLAATGASFVINGSYFERDGRPSVPMVSDGKPLGPAEYDARHGAFVVDARGARVLDLAGKSWEDALAGVRYGTVSYPMLVGEDGASRAKGDERWLANRSFVAEDRDGRIVFGTTKDAYLSLNRLGPFLAGSPLGIRRALNLDGGPLACQGVSVPGHARDFCGEWEMSQRDGQLSLLRPRFPGGRWGLAMVVTARPRPTAAP